MTFWTEIHAEWNDFEFEWDASMLNLSTIDQFMLRKAWQTLDRTDVIALPFA